MVVAETTGPGIEAVQPKFPAARGKAGRSKPERPGAVFTNRGDGGVTQTVVVIGVPDDPSEAIAPRIQPVHTAARRDVSRETSRRLFVL